MVELYDRPGDDEELAELGEQAADLAREAVVDTEPDSRVPLDGFRTRATARATEDLPTKARRPTASTRPGWGDNCNVGADGKSAIHGAPKLRTN